MTTSTDNAKVARDLAELIIPITSFGPQYVEKKAALIESALTTAQSQLAEKVLAEIARNSRGVANDVTAADIAERLRELFAGLGIEI